MIDYSTTDWSLIPHLTAVNDPPFSKSNCLALSLTNLYSHASIDTIPYNSDIQVSYRHLGTYTTNTTIPHTNIENYTTYKIMPNM